MASVICPFCSTEIRHRQFWATANKPFCSNCGWNIGRAQYDAQEKWKTARNLLIGSGIAAAVASGLAIAKTDFPGFLPLAVFVGVISFGYFWENRGTKRALNQAALAGKTDPAASGRAPLLSAYLQKIQTLPRPRRVRLRSTGRIAALLFVMCVAIVASFIYVIADNAKGVSFDWNSLWPILPLLAIIVALVSFMIFEFRNERKKLSLLREGEVAVARVVEQRVIQRGKQSYNEITYEFHLPSGPLVRKTERDHEKAYFEDMLIPVFYDPTSPNDCAALCATYYHFPDAGH